MATDHQPTPGGPLRQVGRFPLILFVTGAVLSQTGLRYKIVPGGPFISIVGEALPILLFLASIVSALCEFRGAPGSARFSLWLVSILSAAGIGFVVDGIIRFWFRPYARGDLFGL
jgi:hypothetical protein